MNVRSQNPLTGSRESTHPPKENEMVRIAAIVANAACLLVICALAALVLVTWFKPWS